MCQKFLFICTGNFLDQCLYICCNFSGQSGSAMISIWATVVDTAINGHCTVSQSNKFLQFLQAFPSDIHISTPNNDGRNSTFFDNFANDPFGEESITQDL